MELQASTHFTNLQQELLKLFSFDLQETELLSIKKILSQHFADKLNKESSKIWDEKGYTQELMDEWLNEEDQ